MNGVLISMSFAESRALALFVPSVAVNMLLEVSRGALSLLTRQDRQPSYSLPEVRGTNNKGEERIEI